MKKLAVLFLLVGKIAFADSPLTSIDFYKAYLNVPMVKKAKASRGKMTPEIMAFLVDEENQQAEKLAVINALGWNHKYRNSKRFRNYIIKTKRYRSDFGGKYTAFLWNATANELVFYAYLSALENYGQPLDALEYLEKAMEKAPQDLNAKLVYELIRGQVYYETGDRLLAKKNINKVLKAYSETESDMHFDMIALRYFYDFLN